MLMLSSSTSEYYAINDRPVKLVPTEEGGMDVLVLNWKTGDFERDMSYLSRCYDPSQDVDQFTEAQFNDYIAQLRQNIQQPNL
jgi:hypothetical protein